MTTVLRVPEELSARVPAEQRGPGLDRDAVRLLVSRGTAVSHHAFAELPRLLRAGDLLVVNTSPTLAAAVDGRIGHARVVVHFSTRGDDGRWAIELRDPDERGTTRPRAGGPAGTEVQLPGGVRLRLEEPLSAESGRLWWARAREAGSGGGTPASATAEGGGRRAPGAEGGSGGGLPGQTFTEPLDATRTPASAPAAGGDSRAPGAAEDGSEGMPGPAFAETRDAAAGTPAPAAVESGNRPRAAVSDAGGGNPGQAFAENPGAADHGGRGTSEARSPGGADAGAVVSGLLREYGRPIRYSYTERDQPLSVYRTVFALPSPDGAGSAEMPSAARPFTARLVAELVSRGVQFAPVVLHTGVASAEAHEAPYAERFAVSEASARLINAVKAGGGRVIAVGTTAVRAVESAVGADGLVRARAGWTDLVVTPERGVRVVDGLLTGLHEPEASHLLMLEAVAGRAAIDRSYEEALRGRYLWHEFGDTHLILPEEDPHAEHCCSNCW
ncbi:S-adenosylmethionine:tRNA ribosyltransferase-isomerase [Streptomyces sp. S.PB5]|uniref:S-adenosylmethionine:tRNA ribosyltransferase-isomerase n=1 Tax=Streptomyces sp. S.PB5 TaxID=3020844 RepID=UPI0025AF41F9|nr:S-adenosylmethionine:tRNA ribosyltransferase-isomerase [Streptomyces sp. S.PB5]MDN3021226.1 S-adenosylmethionine:tRNA ribosyltransferase-isomerase [Streptomyces sp. S.PB5]